MLFTSKSSFRVLYILLFVLALPAMRLSPSRLFYFFAFAFLDSLQMSSVSRSVCILIAVLTALLVAIAALVISAITLSEVSSRHQSPENARVTIARPTVPNSRNTISSASDWWKWTPIYQVYPRSFQDSNGDGTGDLQGIKQRLSYLHDLGIKAVWLSPIYDSPMADFGYDISNFTAIAPVFGTMEDFQELLDEMHKHGMYLIMDYVPNHSSDQHPWFQKSIRDEQPYDDYYVWRDEPNNWISVFGNTSWEYVESRGQYYLHQFLIQQPDLNFRNAKLRQEMVDVLQFWADHGVDGFRIDSVMYLVEDAEFRDETKSGKDALPNHHDYLYHNYTENLPESFEAVRQWTDYLREYSRTHNKHIFVCSEGYTDINHVMQFYSSGVDFAFNFNLVRWNSSTTASELRELISEWMEHMPPGAWPNWVMGNHDNSRVASRLGGRQYIDAANMLLLLLPGTPTYYVGDEIGMIDAQISYADTVDSSGCNWGAEAYKNYSRDPERTPMQWDASPNAGFTTGDPWLPLADGWQTYNVEEESNDPYSHLSVFKALVKLRQEPVFKMATNLRLIHVEDENVFAFAREADDDRYLVVLNIGHDGEVSTIEDVLATGAGLVVIRSGNGDIGVNETVDFGQPFTISNAQGYVIKVL